MLLIEGTMFCLQHPRAAHTMRSDQFYYLKANDISCTPAEVRAAFLLTDANQSADLDLEQFGQFCVNTGTGFGTKEGDRKKTDKPTKR